MEINYVIWIGIIVLAMLVGIVLFVLIEQNETIVVEKNEEPEKPYQGDFWYEGNYYYSQDYFYQVNGYHYTNKMYHENYPMWGEGQKPLARRFQKLNAHFKRNSILTKERSL